MIVTIFNVLTENIAGIRIASLKVVFIAQARLILSTKAQIYILKIYLLPSIHEKRPSLPGPFYYTFLYPVKLLTFRSTLAGTPFHRMGERMVISHFTCPALSSPWAEEVSWLVTLHAGRVSTMVGWSLLA